MFGDIKNMMQQAQGMKKNIEEIQQTIAKETIIGESGAGMVTVTFSGDKIAKAVKIDPELMTQDKEILEELIMAAINDGNKKLEHKKAELMQELAKKYNIPAGMLPF